MTEIKSLIPENKAALLEKLHEAQNALKDGGTGAPDLVSLSRECAEHVQQFATATAFCEEAVSLFGQQVNTVPLWIKKDVLKHLPSMLNGTGSAKSYLWLHNELRAVQEKRLVSELVLQLPAAYSAAKNDGLVSILPSVHTGFDSEDFGRRYSTLLQPVLNGVGDHQSLDKLAALCRESIVADTHEYAAIFWLTCGCYIGCIDHKQVDTSVAHRYVLRQIELVVQQHTVNADTAILSPEGIELVELAMCNMLFYIACAEPTDPVFEQLEARFELQRSLQGITSFSADAVNGAMLDAGVDALRRRLARLKLDIDVLPDSPATAANNAVAALTEIYEAFILIVPYELRIELRAALSALKTYRGRDGTLGDLEVCAASLISADQQLIPVRKSSDSGPWVSVNDSADQLDNALRIEMVSMLEPLEDQHPAEPVGRDWVVAALTDVISLSAFLEDKHLYRQISRLRTAVREDNVEFVVQLGLAIRSYLLETQDRPEHAQSKQKLFASIKRLGGSSSVKAQPEAIPGLSELVSDNADLLTEQSVVEPLAEPAQPQSSQADAVDYNESRADDQSIHTLANALEFGDQCNRYVDTIQLALDTALGSSGNLAPDRTVTTALQNLYQTVSASRQDSLLRLLEPLMQVLSSAEQTGSTLSQTDTLLVQEAIVAITIGLDAVVNKQPMPDLVADVSQRITQMAIEDSHASRAGFEAAGLIDVFVEEGEELGQRLFELFQRWRGAPRSSNQGGSKLPTDIRRLLHTLKGSADTVSLSHIAGLVHALESFMAQQDDKQPEPSAEFFDTAIDAIEVVLDDIDRVRNGESVLPRDEILAQLNSNAAANVSLSPADTMPKQVPQAADESSDSVFERVPAFGSVKYFSRLEKTQKQLSRQCWEANDLHARMRNQLSDMQSSLQSARHLLAKVSHDAQASGLYRSIDESFHDLQQLQNGLQDSIDRVSSIENKQLARAAELESLVLTADKISVESIRLRMEALVQQMASSQSKQLQFEFVGSELELDRKFFADLVAPLEQLLVNAVVHGVDSNQERKQRGKSAKTTIKVVFKISQGALFIEVSDDGAGIDLVGLRRHISKRPGLAQTSFAEDAQVLAAIVEQGVTTTESADRVSGRGVGLDIVKEWVFKHHGKLTVDSRVGQGTEFRIEIPLPSQALQVMVIQQGGHFFAIDIEHVVAVDDADDEGSSLSALLSVTRESEPTVLSCRTAQGLFKLKVERLLGRKTIRFHCGNRIVDESGFYHGAGLLDNRHVVLRLNVDTLSQAVPNQNIVVPQPGKASVLIVDDSVTIRASFGRAMQTAGFHIILARNGLEAMEYLEENQPEVIILDLEMPLMDGYELGAYIRKQPRLSRSALVVVSSKPRSVVGDWLTAVNADAYYEKPCSESVIAGGVAGLA